MKRHPALQQLSREHHAALKLARDTRRIASAAPAAELAALARRVAAAFAADLDPHFRLEEQGVLVLLLEAGEQDLVRRTAAEHQELRDLVTSLARPAASALHRFADLLEAHVRFEERELFEKAQAAMMSGPPGAR